MTDFEEGMRAGIDLIEARADWKWKHPNQHNPESLEQAIQRTVQHRIRKLAREVITKAKGE